MLRILLSCFILCVLAVGINGQNPDKLRAYFEEKCFNNSRNKAASAKLSGDVEGFQNYINYVAKLVPDDMNNFCNRERNQFSMRINEIANDLKPCLSSNEQFLIDFVNVSLNEFVHFMCHGDAKYTKRFFGDQCHKTLLDNPRTDLDSCFRKIFPLRSGTFTKQEVCSNINTAKECLRRSLDQLCPNNKSFQELNDKLFEYISKPCSGCYHYLNSLLLMMCVIMSYLFSR